MCIRPPILRFYETVVVAQSLHVKIRVFRLIFYLYSWTNDNIDPWYRIDPVQSTGGLLRQIPRSVQCHLTDLRPDVTCSLGFSEIMSRVRLCQRFCSCVKGNFWFSLALSGGNAFWRYHTTFKRNQLLGLAVPIMKLLEGEMKGVRRHRCFYAIVHNYWIFCRHQSWKRDLYTHKER